MGSEFKNWELPKRVSVEVAKKYFYWWGLELASRIMTEWEDEKTIGAELDDIRATLLALDREEGEVILTISEMAPCGVAYERI